MLFTLSIYYYYYYYYYFRDFKLFYVNLNCRNCPSARCASAANAISGDICIFNDINVNIDLDAVVSVHATFL
jgi:hypothetical protein